MSQIFVKYFEAQIGAMLMQVTCNVGLDPEDRYMCGIKNTEV